jgi:predicted Fe-Mo cluster-binding NifX family protein
MKICIPILQQQGFDSPISSHFGQASGFALVDEETNMLSFMLNSGHHHGGPQTPAELIAEAGANIVLCGGLGRNAVRLLRQHNIQVYTQASGTVAETLKAYQDGALPEATEATACQHHAHGHGGHGHGHEH